MSTRFPVRSLRLPLVAGLTLRVTQAAEYRLLRPGGETPGLRFCRIWRWTWRRLPPSARATLTAYWAAGSRPLRVQLCCRTDFVGFCGLRGFVLAFRWDLDVIAWQKVAGVVAHELLHVLDYAEGTVWPDEEVEERETWRRVGSWGFATPDE